MDDGVERRRERGALHAGGGAGRARARGSERTDEPPSERTRAPRADDGEVAGRRADGARATACASDARERPVVSRGPTLRGHERTARGPTPGPGGLWRRPRCESLSRPSGWGLRGRAGLSRGGGAGGAAHLRREDTLVAARRYRRRSAALRGRRRGRRRGQRRDERADEGRTRRRRRRRRRERLGEEVERSAGASARGARLSSALPKANVASNAHWSSSNARGCPCRLGPKRGHSRTATRRSPNRRARSAATPLEAAGTTATSRDSSDDEAGCRRAHLLQRRARATARANGASPRATALHPSHRTRARRSSQRQTRALRQVAHGVVELRHESLRGGATGGTAAPSARCRASAPGPGRRR